LVLARGAWFSSRNLALSRRVLIRGIATNSHLSINELFYK
jgi:hypothetical protein